MTFMRNSLSQALHSLRNPHLPGHFRAYKKKPEEDASSKKAFDGEIYNQLLCLDIPADQGFLTLSWLQGAVKLVHVTCAHISDLLPKISCSEKERVLLESNLEDTLSLLDVCNGLKETLNDVQHYVMLVRYAARTGMDVKDVSDEEFKARLSRMHTSLTKSAEFMQSKVEENNRHIEGRSKLEMCSSMLRRMGEPLYVASPGTKRAASNAVFNDMYGAKVLAIFVCSVLAMALSIKPKRALSLVHMAEQPPWLEVLQTVQQNTKQLTDNFINQGKIALLKELDEVRERATELHKTLDESSKREMPFVDVDKLSLSEQCKGLCKDADALQEGLLQLQQHLDRLFRMLVTIRVDFLDAVCHV